MVFQEVVFDFKYLKEVHNIYFNMVKMIKYCSYKILEPITNVILCENFTNKVHQRSNITLSNRPMVSYLDLVIKEYLYCNGVC